MKTALRHFWPELIITIAVWAIMGWQFGLSAFILTVILSILEITLSADNAVVNSKILVQLSPFWQKMFLTVGILIAVFGVRFALPIVMVALTTSLDITSVFSLALHDPSTYAQKLHEVAPLIDGFGGMFLLMVVTIFFFDRHRQQQTFWIKPLEPLFVHWGKWLWPNVVLPVVAFVAVLSAIGAEERAEVAVAMVLGAATYLALHGITLLMERFDTKKQKHSGGQQVGWIAFTLFVYLQVLDASFSLDGVVGAFAITANIIIIMAGLGVGALWVRSITIYMVEQDTLLKYRYLDAGAHWAILSLALVMFLKLVGVELPEVVIGMLGLVFITAAVISSVYANKTKSMIEAK